MSMVFLLLAQASAVPAAVPADAFADRAWARFSRHGALSHRGETVDIASDRLDGGVLQYRLRLVRRHLDRVEPPRWIDSRLCPAVREVLVRMEKLQMPQPDAPGVGTDQSEIILDGAGYMLEVPSTYSSNGKLTLRSNVASPLATWIDGSLAALEPCWSAVELRHR